MKTTSYAPTALVNLTRGFVSIVSRDDLAWINSNKWGINTPEKTPYARRLCKRVAVSLHVAVWEKHNGRKVSPGMEIHHRNGNSLDNRIENLEEVNRSINNAMRPYGKKGRLLPKGVYKNKGANRYIAVIRLNGKNFFLGSFIQVQDAKAAFDSAWNGVYGRYK